MEKVGNGQRLLIVQIVNLGGHADRGRYGKGM